MISSRVVASALRAQAPALQAVKTRPAARIFQQSRGFKNTTKLREPIPVRPTRLSLYAINSMLTPIIEGGALWYAILKITPHHDHTT